MIIFERSTARAFAVFFRVSSQKGKNKHMGVLSNFSTTTPVLFIWESSLGEVGGGGGGGRPQNYNGEELTKISLRKSKTKIGFQCIKLLW